MIDEEQLRTWAIECYQLAALAKNPALAERLRYIAVKFTTRADQMGATQGDSQPSKGR